MAAPIFNDIARHFPEQYAKYLKGSDEPLNDMLFEDPSGKNIIGLVEHILNIENWENNKLLERLTFKSFEALSDMELEQPQLNEVRRLSKIYEFVIHKPQKKRKREEDDVPIGRKEVKKEHKGGLDDLEKKVAIDPRAQKIISDILEHTKRGNDDRLYLENKDQLEVLIDYYVKDKEDAHEPRARDMLKGMLSIPRKNYPTDEEFAEIKKLPKNLGRLIHPDKFSSASPELSTTMKEIFQFLDTCLDNSGYKRR